MQTFDQSIFALYQQGFVTLEEALRWASNVDEFKLKVQGISTTSDLALDEMARTLAGGQRADYAIRIGTPIEPRIIPSPGSASPTPNPEPRTPNPESRTPNRRMPSAYIDGCSCWDGGSCRCRSCGRVCSIASISSSEVDAAIARLLETRRAGRCAGLPRAFARTAAKVKGRGRLRVMRELQAMGIPHGRRRRSARGRVRRPRRTRADRQALQKKLRGRPADCGSRGDTPACTSFSMRQGFSRRAAISCSRVRQRGPGGE